MVADDTMGSFCYRVAEMDPQEPDVAAVRDRKFLFYHQKNKY